MIITITRTDNLAGQHQTETRARNGAKLEMTVLDGRIVLLLIAEDLEVLFKSKEGRPKLILPPKRWMK